MTKNFALIRVGRYIAPRHLKAIRDTGNLLVAAVDPKDSVGILGKFSYDVRFFTEIERFDRHLEKLRRTSTAEKVDYVSICSPNYLHDAHCRLAMRIGADVICEKPIALGTWTPCRKVKFIIPCRCTYSPVSRVWATSGAIARTPNALPKRPWPCRFTRN